MTPTLKDKQKILALTNKKFLKIQVNNIIIFKRNNKNYIKKVIELGKQITVQSDKTKQTWKVKQNEIIGKKLF